MKMDHENTDFLDRKDFSPPFERKTSERSGSDPERPTVENVHKPLQQTRSLCVAPPLNAGSPIIQKLTRMDCYRTLPKSTSSSSCDVISTTASTTTTLTTTNSSERKRCGKPKGSLAERRTTSSGVERVKRKKEDRRQRSQSSPMFMQDIDVTDPSLGASTPMTSDESIENETANRENGKRTPSLIRKKSLASLKDFGKKLIDHKTKITRTQSQKCPEKPDPLSDTTKKSATDDDTGREDAGPLFPAATLYVPGYDHKTKQFTTLPTKPSDAGGRKTSTPQLDRRRSSRNSMSLILDKAKVVTRQSSTPCLFKRDSKEKLKKIELIIDEKIDETCSNDSESATDKETNVNDENTSTTLPQSSNENSPTTLVDKRKALIASKQEQFRQKGRSVSSESSSSLPINNLHVRHIATKFDDGSAFIKVKSLAHQTSDLSLNNRLYYENSRNYDNAYDSSRDCENERKYLLREFNAHNNNRASRSWTSGMESGYSSPVDNFNMEKEFGARSWSENDEHKWMSIPSRDCTRDLCATVL